MARLCSEGESIMVLKKGMKNVLSALEKRAVNRGIINGAKVCTQP